MTTAAILTAANAPLELHQIAWQPLHYGQVLVRVIATGICGAQLQEVRGEKGTHFPRLLGHEACGEILEIGPGVKTVAVGDRVVCHWRKGSGIESESPSFQIQYQGMQTHTAGQITTFSTHSVISENRLTAVPRDTPVEIAALLGCGLSTALATIENEASVGFGESVLIVGFGGLGVNLAMAARLRGAGGITVADQNADKVKLAMDLDVGFHGPNCEPNNFGGPYDVVIDTTGNPDAIAGGIAALSPSGRFVMVGQPKPRENILISNARHLFDGSGKTVLATQGGRFDPSEDMFRYARLAFNILDYQKIITHRLPLSDINRGLDLVRQGQAGRILISCDE